MVVCTKTKTKIACKNRAGNKFYLRSRKSYLSRAEVIRSVQRVYREERVRQKKINFQNIYIYI